MKNRDICIIGALLLILSSCNFAKTKAKEGVNLGGEIVGETIGEFSKGVEESLTPEITTTKELENLGIELGLISVINGGQNDNIVNVYLSFDEAVDSVQFVMKVETPDGREFGRQTLIVSSEAGDAGFYDFVFDERTDIDHDTQINLGIRKQH